MWFTETPWPPIFLFSVVSILLVAAWYANKRAIFLVAAIVIVGLCGLIYLVEDRIVTDAERVEANIFAMTTAYEQADLAGTLSYVSPKAVEIRLLITGAILLYDVEDDLRITDIDVKLQAENSIAVSHFRANGSISVPSYGKLGYQPSRWEFTWRKEADQWKVTRIRRLNPISGEELPVLTPTRQ